MYFDKQNQNLVTISVGQKRNINLEKHAFPGLSRVPELNLLKIDSINYFITCIYFVHLYFLLITLLFIFNVDFN